MQTQTREATTTLLLGTIEIMLREQLPNLFRLYMNPFVAQTCFCLDQFIHHAWPACDEPYQSFLANSFDEALSGAIKLARYAASSAGKPTTGLIVDAGNRLGSFASARTEHGTIEFVPGLTVVCSKDNLNTLEIGPIGFLVLTGPADSQHAEAIRRFAKDDTILIVCVGAKPAGVIGAPPRRRPDIVVFDDSFVAREVPFGAFSARKSLYDLWNNSAKSTFHSTTFQPNTISAMHFMRCLTRHDPDAHARPTWEPGRIMRDFAHRVETFRRLYSPSLVNAMTMTECDTPKVRADGHYVYVDDRKIFDAVAGVACSVRGHNPPTYADEMAALDGVDVEAELQSRLHELTGLDHMLPGVSGAGAIEAALKLALVAQAPRRHVLALKSGFGGKTLFALTGTWNASYKERIDPLYPDVLYVDPFAPDAIAQIDAALDRHPIAVVQAELVQGVGGVRQVPDAVVRHLAARRAEHDYLLLIDEVQTGMYRTGPFARSVALGLSPDLLVVGKAASDMMFPFALSLYSANVQARIDRAGSPLPDEIRGRFGYEYGYRTVLNALRLAEALRLPERVAEAGDLFERTLKVELATCEAVRDVRVFGLLIGIELDAARWPQRWFAKKLFWFYLRAMLMHPAFPVLVGFCQYEPNVLKITPPLTTNADEIKAICATLGDVLRRPFWKLLASSAAGYVKFLWRRKP